jgi:hypothetical protein
LLLIGNGWRGIVIFQNYSSTRWKNPIAQALSAKDFISKSMLNNRSFCGIYGVLLSTFYHDIPCDCVFSETIKNSSRDFCNLLYHFSVLVGNWRTAIAGMGEYTGIDRGIEGANAIV